ncbi:MAG: LexA family protein [Segatella copri]
MYPKILDGDIVIFREQQPYENGDICVVRIDGTDAALKNVIQNKYSVVLQPLNPDFEPLVFSDSAVDQPSLEVIGVAKEIQREL